MSIIDGYSLDIPIGEAEFEESDCPVKTVIEFVRFWLPDFAKSAIQNNIKNEKGLTNKLIKKLSVNCDSYPFAFNKDDMEVEKSGVSPSPDIGVITKNQLKINYRTFSSEDTFFVFEAKILGVAEKNREKEYVIGFDKQNGGIERFKRCIHGRKLKAAGMIGYVLKEDYPYWFSIINEWINELKKGKQELIWKDEDNLIEMDKIKSIPKYESTHLRKQDCKSNSPIKLYHLWVKIY